MCWTELPTYIGGDKDISIAHPSLEVMKYLTDNLHNFVVVIVIVVAGKGGVVHPLNSGLGHSR